MNVKNSLCNWIFNIGFFNNIWSIFFIWVSYCIDKICYEFTIKTYKISW